MLPHISVCAAQHMPRFSPSRLDHTQQKMHDVGRPHNGFFGRPRASLARSFATSAKRCLVPIYQHFIPDTGGCRPRLSRGVLAAGMREQRARDFSPPHAGARVALGMMSLTAHLFLFSRTHQRTIWPLRHAARKSRLRRSMKRYFSLEIFPRLRY